MKKKITMIEVVVGAGFGDEGKGITVARICKKIDSGAILNVKFSGGPQSGHTVYNAVNSHHVFSTLGAGSFTKNVDTFLYKTFAFDPFAYLAEMNDFEKKFGYFPKVYVHGECPVITPLDILRNRSDSINRLHGTVGSGVGTTFKRHEEHNLMLYANDFKSLSRTYIIHKLKQISAHYSSSADIESMYDVLAKAFEKITVWTNYEFLDYTDYVFEGSQGFYLDRDFGFFPHVTRSYCTVKNAVPLIKYIRKRKRLRVGLNMVSRCYLTRHGNGPFDEAEDFSEYFTKSKHESNDSSHEYQGRFKKGFLNIPMLKYAMNVNDSMLNFDVKNLHITCLDQIKDIDKFPVIENGKLDVKCDGIAYLESTFQKMNYRFFAYNSPNYGFLGNEVSWSFLYNPII